MKLRWVFALPPSVADRMKRALDVRGVLTSVGCGSVHLALTYSALMTDLENGHVDAAWAPPLVCAHVERLGGRVVLRAVRAGASTYRSALFTRRADAPGMAGLKGLRAAWLDQHSLAGYVLPRGVLRHQGVDPDTCFSRQKFLGSFEACVDAVLNGKVDVSSTYATSASASPQRVGWSSLAGARASELTALAFSPECPNDGIILSPALPQEQVARFTAAFQELTRERETNRLLAKALDVDGFDLPPPGTYAALHEKHVEAAARPA
jgi:ABC-type phosphate/phosphonate transport system substrate-binding protein